jgi:hypothetical protein
MQHDLQSLGGVERQLLDQLRSSYLTHRYRRDNLHARINGINHRWARNLLWRLQIEQQPMARFRGDLDDHPGLKRRGPADSWRLVRKSADAEGGGPAPFWARVSAASMILKALADPVA